jgi:hypothetical protein
MQMGRAVQHLVARYRWKISSIVVTAVGHRSEAECLPCYIGTRPINEILSIVHRAAEPFASRCDPSEIEESSSKFSSQGVISA